MESYAMPFSGKRLAASTAAPGKFSGVCTFPIFFWSEQGWRGQLHTYTSPDFARGMTLLIVVQGFMYKH
jgi:hypothetical protein